MTIYEFYYLKNNSMNNQSYLKIHNSPYATLLRMHQYMSQPNYNDSLQPFHYNLWSV